MAKAATGLKAATLGSDLLRSIGLDPRKQHNPQAISDAFHAKYDALLDRLSGVVGDARTVIQGELITLQQQHAHFNDLASVLASVERDALKLIPKPLLDKMPVQEGGLLETAGSRTKAVRGLIDTLFKRPNGDVHPGKVGAAIAVGASLVAVVGYFMLREEKPTSQVADVMDAQLLATLNQRQV